MEYGFDSLEKVLCVARRNPETCFLGKTTVNLRYISQLVHASACVCRDVEHAGSLESTKKT